MSSDGSASGGGWILFAVIGGIILAYITGCTSAPKQAQRDELPFYMILLAH